MKYNININQLALKDSGFDLIDCAILYWIIDYCNSRSAKVISRRKNGYTQIDYQSLIDENPLMGIRSKGAITPRIKKIEEAGYIKVSRVIHQSNYIDLTEKVDELFTKMNSSSQKLFTTVNRAVHENEQLVPKAVHDGEPTIIQVDDPYTITLPETEVSNLTSQTECLIKEFEAVNKACSQFYGRPPQRKACADLVGAYGYEKVMLVVSMLPKLNRILFNKATTPLELWNKWAKIEAEASQLKERKTQNKYAITRTY